MSENVDQGNSQQSESENTCVVCFKRTLIFSVGSCNHPVCFECSARMRCLLLQNECPICRQDLPKVIFTKTIDSYSTLDKTTRSGLFEKKYRIIFADLDIQKSFYHLLEHRCPKCENLFVDFHKLKEHVRKTHEHFYCEICTENLKIFSSERRCYNRTELAQHRRVGDADDKSHRGHPRCDYCELRYLDKDELFRHLRREHYFCHLCDADGVNLFYGTIREMRDHFKAEHFLCEEEDCLDEEFSAVAVFRTEIDLRAHKATVHSKTMSRAEVKQARVLELDFSYGPRGRGGGNSGNHNHNNNHRGGRIRTNDTQREFDVNPEPEIFQHPPIQIDTKNEEHFPSLGGPSSSGNVQLANSVRHVVYGQAALARTRENFPALGGPSSSGSEKGKNQPKQNNASKQNSSSNKQSGPTASSLFKASKNPQQQQQPQKQQKPSSSSSNSSNNIKNPTFKKDDDFPSLGPSSSKTSFFSEAPRVSSNDKRPLSTSAQKILSKSAPPKKDTSLGSANASKKRDLMEDLILPSNNDITKSTISSKHRGLVNDYVSVASQVTKVNIVKQKDESNSAENHAQSVPKLNSINNFPTLGADDSAGKPMPWVTVSNSKSNTSLKPQQIGTKSNNNQTPKTKQNNEVPQKNQKSNGTKKAAHEKKVLKDSVQSKENLAFTDQQHMIPPVKAPPGFKPLQSPTYRYLLLPDASKRNQALVEEFQKVLKTNESMQEFRLLSQMFRDGNYFARSYFESCKGVLGEKFDTIFPELLVLLPDIEKQQKLYRIYQEESLIDVDITDDITSKKKNKKSLEVCATCQQVLLGKDLIQHVQSHSLENNFPTLSNEISSSAKSKTAGKK